MDKRPIHRVKATNFLSLESIDLNLQPLNVLAGPNGSGKSNFLKIFDFLGNIAEKDLFPAVNQYGGMDWLTFQNADSQSISISIEGEITQHSHLKALDEYSLAFEPLKISPASERLKNYNLLRREEQFKFKRLTGPGRRITLSGQDLKIYDRSSKKVLDAESVSDSTSGLALLRRLGRDYEGGKLRK